MPYNQGDIVLLNFPLSDLSGTNQRPAIVVSNEDINNSDDVILAAITSQIRGDNYSFLLDDSELTTSLPKTSEVRCHKLFTCDQTSIIRKISELDFDALKQLTKKIRLCFTTS